MNATPSGASMRPSIPDRKKSGTKLTMMMRVEFRIGILTSFEASNTTFSMGSLSAAGSALFALICFQTFSTSTMASSTSEPMAMARPPRLMVLMVMPIQFSVSMEISIDSGSVISDMMVVLTLARKSMSTITTNIAPSYSDDLTLLMELSMNLAWRKVSVDIFTSGGRFFCTSFRASSSFAVSSSVPVSGCLVTVTSTAGLPFSEASPSLGCCAPICTSATSSRVTGAPPTVLMTLLAISFTSSVETMPRTIYSFPYS